MTHTGTFIAEKNVTLANNEKKNVKIIQCDDCNFAHLDPLPTLSDLGEFYAYHFYEKQKPQYIIKMEEEGDYWHSLYQWRYQIIQKLLNNPSPKLLDVGSSAGFFLNAAKKLGASVVGIEPSEKAAAYCRDTFKIKDVHVDIYENCNFEPESFDIIHSSLVIEHLLDPQNFIKWSYKNLKKGGIFIVETPHEFNSYQNLLVKKMSYDPWYIAYPDHINYFSKDSLQKLGEKFDMKLEKHLCTFPMEHFVLTGKDYLKDPSKGLSAHQARMQFELNLLKNNEFNLLEAHYKQWSDLKIGRTQIVYFRK